MIKVVASLGCVMWYWLMGTVKVPIVAPSTIRAPIAGAKRKRKEGYARGDKRYQCQNEQGQDKNLAEHEYEHRITEVSE